MNKILRRLHVSDAKKKKSACSQSLIAFSWVSVVIVPTKICYLPTKQWEESHVSDAKVQQFRLARSARSQQLVGISRVSGFLVGIMNKTISRVLQTQGHNFTDKRWFINKILRRIVCFQRKYKQIRLARNHIHFLQFPTCRYKSSLIRPSWYYQHTWTNTRTYCTDKNIYQQNTEKNRMFPTPNIRPLPPFFFKNSERSCLSLYPWFKKNYTPPPPPPPPAHQRFRAGGMVQGQF